MANHTLKTPDGTLIRGGAIERRKRTNDLLPRRGGIWNDRLFPIVMPVTRLGLGGVLLYAGVLKIPNSAAFSVAVANYDLLPKHLVPLVAVTLPWIEVLTGLALICGVWLGLSARISLGMFAIFSAAVISALIRDLDIECGCFETETGTRIGWQTLIIEGACMLASLMVVLFPCNSLIGHRPPE